MNFQSLPETYQVVSLKLCESCGTQFTRQGDIKYCGNCLKTKPWLAKEPDYKTTHGFRHETDKTLSKNEAYWTQWMRRLQ
jgi:hypothetical protein